MSAEGKTVTSCNLAVACARNGQRTLLVDFDLRRPRLVGIFPMPPKTRGLPDFLASRDVTSDIESLVYATYCPNLSVVASRPVHGASPAELIGSQRVADLVRWTRARFDRVVLDAPPLS
jgi:Mrp family chromosome partitioning ATPase